MSEGQNVFHHNLFVYFEESLRGTTELSECFTELAEQTINNKNNDLALKTMASVAV